MDHYHETTPKTELKSAVLGREASRKKASQPKKETSLLQRLKEEAKSHQTVYEDDRRRKALLLEAAEKLQQLRQLIDEADEIMSDEVRFSK